MQSNAPICRASDFDWNPGRTRHLTERPHMIPSLPKLLALGAVIWAVWMGFRLIERRGPGKGDGTDQAGQDGKKSNRALDLEECAVCHAWVAGEACDRDACPYRGDSA